MSTDPGPLARLEDILAKSDTMSVIVQRITDADQPDTLKEIAKDWRVPLGRLSEWITADRDRAEQYANALRIAGETAALEVIKVADEAKDRDSAAAAKVRIDARRWVAGRLARDRFGDSSEVRHTGQVSLVAVLSSMPKGNVIDVTPAPQVLEQNVPPKIPPPPGAVKAAEVLVI